MRRLGLAILLIVTVRVDAALTKSDLQAWLEEALAQAQQVPPEERRDAAYSVKLTGKPEEKVKACLLKIALRPTSSGWLNLLGVVPPEDEQFVREFLESEYRARAGMESEERRSWQQGLAEMLFTTGRFADGLELLRPVVVHGGASAYAVDLLAIMEKVAGNEEAYRRVAADPPQPEPSVSSDEATTYFQSVVKSVTDRMGSVMPREKVPPQMAEMLGSGATWKERMRGLVMLASADPAAAERELAKVLGDSTPPPWVHEDALLALAQALGSSSANGARMLNVLECWIARRGLTSRKATAETWEALRHLPSPSQPSSFEELRQCFRFEDHDTTTPACELAIASRLYIAAVNAKSHEALQRTIEWNAALTVEHRRDPAAIATDLLIAANRAPSDEQRSQILRYLGSFPSRDLGEFEEEVADAVRRQTVRGVNAPWSNAPRPATRRCP